VVSIVKIVQVSIMVIHKRSLYSVQSDNVLSLFFCHYRFAISPLMIDRQIGGICNY
jgi:hypothetical protein